MKTMKSLRTLAAAAALFALAACGQSNAPAQGGEAAQTEDGVVILDHTRDMPDWLFILRTTDGGTIHFNQRTITRQNGMADIWLQVRYGRDQLWDASDEQFERVIHYQTERMHYRFNCAEESFVIVERQIMGANDTVVARDQPAQIFRPTPSAGAAQHVLPIACRGA